MPFVWYPWPETPTDAATICGAKEANCATTRNRPSGDSETEPESGATGRELAPDCFASDMTSIRGVPKFATYSRHEEFPGGRPGRFRRHDRQSVRRSQERRRALEGLLAPGRPPLQPSLALRSENPKGISSFWELHGEADAARYGSRPWPRDLLSIRRFCGAAIRSRPKKRAQRRRITGGSSMCPYWVLLSQQFVRRPTY